MRSRCPPVTLFASSFTKLSSAAARFFPSPHRALGSRYPNILLLHWNLLVLLRNVETLHRSVSKGFHWRLHRGPWTPATEFNRARGILLVFSARSASFNPLSSHISALSASADARFFSLRVGAKSRISRTSLLFAKKFLPTFRRNVASHLFSLISSL